VSEDERSSFVAMTGAFGGGGGEIEREGERGEWPQILRVESSLLF
jgi:hypothetical protein